MSRRIPFKGQTQGQVSKLQVAGYRPTANSRFAVTRPADRPDAPWLLIHVRTGMGVSSVLPAVGRKLTMTDKLAVAAAWETLTHLDWSAFDELPEIGPDSNKQPVIDQARAGPTVRAMRELAEQVLS